MKLSIATTTMIMFAAAPWSAMVSGLVAAPTPRGFREFGQTLVGHATVRKAQLEGGALEFGSVVHVSDDGRFLAVGAPSTSTAVGHTSGSVSLYERDDATIDEAVEEATWRPVWDLVGESALGDRLDLSGDGTTLAVRRGDSTVEVYRVEAATGASTMLGAPIDVCRDGPNNQAAKGSKTVALGKTASAAGASTSGDWVTVSCEDFDAYRGKVVALKFDTTAQAWVTMATIEGQSKGDRFGWATTMSVYGSSIVTIAVSSPNYDHKRGMVQVFGFGSSGIVSQSGGDMVGQSEGDQFGFSLDMNAVGKRFLVIGAPQCHGDRDGMVSRGCVSLYAWGRTAGWVLAGQPVIGKYDSDKLGRAVAISKDGYRVAATSYLHDRQAGMVNLYQRDGDTRIKQIASFVGDEQVSRWGYSVALNQAGSLVVAGASRAKNDKNAPVGKVTTYLDANPFCGIPTVVTPTNDLFLARKTCRTTIDNTITTEYACLLNEVNTVNGELACVWVDGLATQSPSSSPSAMPSSSPTNAPSLAPSVSPTYAPSVAPTANPTNQDGSIGDNDGTGNDGGSGSGTTGYGSNSNTETLFPRQQPVRPATMSPTPEDGGLEEGFFYWFNEWKVLVIAVLVGLTVLAVGIGARLGRCRKAASEEAATTTQEATNQKGGAKQATTTVEVEHGNDVEQSLSSVVVDETHVEPIDVEQGILTV